MTVESTIKPKLSFFLARPFNNFSKQRFYFVKVPSVQIFPPFIIIAGFFEDKISICRKGSLYSVTKAFYWWLAVRECIVYFLINHNTFNKLHIWLEAFCMSFPFLFRNPFFCAFGWFSSHLKKVESFVWKYKGECYRFYCLQSHCFRFLFEPNFFVIPLSPILQC